LTIDRGKPNGSSRRVSPVGRYKHVGVRLRSVGRYKHVGVRLRSVGRYKYVGVRLVFIAFTTAVLTAVVVQDFTHVLPLGLVNSGFERYRLFSSICLVACAAALGILIADLVAGRPARLARIIRGSLVFIVILEALLVITDTVLINRPDASLLGGPYREMRTDRGTTLILCKPQPNSPFGFRTDHPYQPVIGMPRVLFLGDSYTEGSGSAEECNYPDVVEAVLGARLGRNVEVMNAGVSGYGPREALTLLRELRHMGYAFDAVVYNFFIENDFTDNLPGTERRVVAGISFRFPKSRFLRYFHPFNTRIVRWSLFADALIRFERRPDAPSPPNEGPCDLRTESLSDVSVFLKGMVEKGLTGVKRAAGSPRALAETAETILQMRREADDLGVPFALVVFPDRILADGELAGKLGLDPSRLEASRELQGFLHEELRDLTVWDTTDLLSGRPGMYRPNDSHLSDAGNVVVGEWVGDRLTALLH
jgi:hypothetical protein